MVELYGTFKAPSLITFPSPPLSPPLVVVEIEVVLVVGVMRSAATRVDVAVSRVAVSVKTCPRVDSSKAKKTRHPAEGIDGSGSSLPDQMYGGVLHSNPLLSLVGSIDLPRKSLNLRGKPVHPGTALEPVAVVVVVDTATGTLE
jgi:hypothetical protein